MSIAFNELAKAELDTADVLVRIRKKHAIAPQIKKYANICVYTKKKGSSDLDGELVTESNKSSHASKIEDADEINFVGSVKVWNAATLTQKHVDAMAAYGETLIVTSSKLDEIKTNSTSLNFKNMVVWLTETAATTTLDNVIKLPNRGAFIDTEKKGKALYAVSSLLRNPDNLQYTTQIQSATFHGIVDIDLAEKLDDAGFSYFFKAHDLCWARGFWIAGNQARSVYADRSVIYDVKNSVSKMIQNGADFSHENIALLEARILQALKINPFVIQIFSISIPPQKPSNKVRGLVSGISIKYETAQEIRTVVIELDSLA